MRSFASACDRLVLGGLCLLTAGAPLAFGSVHRVSYACVELVVFLLVAVAAAKVAIAGPPAIALRRTPRALWLPAVLLALLGPLQLVPLPPGALARLSPGAHELLSQSLPGWPGSPPYADLAEALAEPGDASVRPHVLLTAEEAGRLGAASSAEPATRLGPAARELSTTSELSTARPLSIAPDRTVAASLKILAYLAAFFLVLFYPWNAGESGERAAERTLLRWLVGTAVAIAALALVQRFTWNGRMLWTFVPHDWVSGPDPRPRVCGPFINRNNLAGYLALLLPLVLVFASGRTRFTTTGDGVLQRLGRWIGASLVGSALLLSLSRGGWIAAAAGVLTLGLLLSKRPRAERPAFLRSKRAVLAACGAVLVLSASIALIPVGGETERNELDARIGETFSDSASFTQRVAIWREALEALRDFPALGAGLGSWAAIARRYDRPPAGDGFPREVHNDYLQLLVEGGWLAGLLALVFAVATARLLYRGVAKRSPRGAPLVAAALAGLVASAVHAGVDFDMQIPAIPLTLAILCATALRSVLPLPDGSGASHRAMRLRASGLATAAVGAIAVALLQPPADDASLPAPTTLAEATERIGKHPASSLAHLRLYDLLGPAASPRARVRELEIAHELAPRHPLPSDLLVAELAAAGEEDAALVRLEESVRFAPRVADHVYLEPRTLVWLDEAEASAVERGLRAARADDPEASVSLAYVLRHRGRSAEAAAVLLDAVSEGGHGEREQVDMLVQAADLLLETDEPARADAALRDALALSPASTAAWIRRIAATARRDGSAAAARPLVESAVKAGADPSEAWFALAEAAKATGEKEEQREALERTLAVRPALAKAHFELGLLELESGRAKRAVASLRRTTELDPENAAAWYHLGRAEAAAYRLGEARRAYARALEVEPDHAKAEQALASLGLP